MFNVNMKTRSLQTKPYMLCNGDGQRLESLGAQVSILATSEQTGGTFNLFDVSCELGFATPLHIHYTEDVVVYVLEGTLTFFWGSEKKDAVAGTYIFQPRGTPHGFRVEGETPARILYWAIPAGLDKFIVQQAGMRSFDCANNAARYKIEILGPLPE